MSALLIDKETIAATDFASSYAANADLGVILDYVAKKHPELAKKLPKLSQQYRKYMFLMGCGMFQQLSSPSDEVKLIWEAHIHHHDIYSDFCHNSFGSYIQCICN